jgi:hypothetical protein
MGKIGSFNDVAISPDALEKFANDPAAAAEMEAELQQFIDLEQSDKDAASKIDSTLLGRGMVVDKNGETSFWAVGASTSNTFGPSVAQTSPKVEEQAQRHKPEAFRRHVHQNCAVEKQPCETFSVGYHTAVSFFALAPAGALATFRAVPLSMASVRASL